MSESLNAGLMDTCSSGRSERDQTHHCATLTTYIGAAGLQGIPRHPGGLLPPISPPQALLHHTVPNNPGAVPRQNHIGWLSGAHCHCHPHSRHRILHILMHLLLLLLAQHLLQGILGTITADLPHQGKDLCMRAVRSLTLLQSRRLTRCTSMMRSPTCIISMLLTVSLSMSGAQKRLSMHSAPHAQCLLISFCKPNRLSMHSVPYRRCLLNTLSKPSRLSMQSMLLTSRQGTGCIWALLQLLCNVIKVQLSLYATLLPQAKCSQTFLLVCWPNQNLITHTHSNSGLYVAEPTARHTMKGKTCIKHPSCQKGRSIACTRCLQGVLPITVQTKLDNAIFQVMFAKMSLQ